MANKYGHFGLKVKTPEAGGPYFIGFKDKDYVQLSNVMIGEVWICAGSPNGSDGSCSVLNSCVR